MKGSEQAAGAGVSRRRLNLKAGVFQPDKLRTTLSFLRGQEHEAEGRRLSLLGAVFAKIRYGARAFSTLEGYASRNRETELAPLGWI